MNDRIDGTLSGEDPYFSALAPRGVGGDSTTFAPYVRDRSRLSRVPASSLHVTSREG
jgi:hypothetical protein